MAYRRSIITRAKSFYQHQPRLSPSLSHITSSDREEFSTTKTISTNSQICSRFLRNRTIAGNSYLLSGNVSRLIGSKIPASYGLILHRNFSNVPSEIEDLDFNDVVGAVGDKAVEAAPAVNEVAIAAADSFAPVAAFQYLIDYVHCYTGFEWWASIAATTLLIRFIFLPLLINSIKFELEYDRAKLRKASAELDELISKLIKKHAISESDIERATEIAQQHWKTLRELKLLAYIMTRGCACLLFFAILNMAENIPSFAAGGTLWFTDLTTPDHSLRLPVLFALTYWFRIELDPRLLVQPGKIENMLYPSLASVVAVMAGLPAAVYCYWISTNLFSIALSIAMMNPRVMKLLGITLRPPSTGKKIK